MGDNSSSSADTVATMAQLLAAMQSISERMTRLEKGQQAQDNNQAQGQNKNPQGPQQHQENQQVEKPDINIPTLRQAPRTRSGTRGVIASFGEAIEGLFAKNNTSSSLEDITNRLDKLTISGTEARE
ncbi:hypothetical protein Bca52824_011329 [Brassica carinata]|uniref:Uncharacterized protein n=1 Tax=Brassica carinata TaxID=52824 RepID=A0A8X7WFM5_BRACI|nr:hypothetical protein Bca52824_011329 [Brassica carinata]